MSGSNVNFFVDRNRFILIRNWYRLKPRVFYLEIQWTKLILVNLMKSHSVFFHSILNHRFVWLKSIDRAHRLASFDESLSLISLFMQNNVIENRIVKCFVSIIYSWLNDEQIETIHFHTIRLLNYVKWSLTWEWLEWSKRKACAFCVPELFNVMVIYSFSILSSFVFQQHIPSFVRR